MLLKKKHLNQKPKKVFQKQNVLISEDMLLKWFCDRRPSVTEAKLFTDVVLFGGVKHDFG